MTDQAQAAEPMSRCDHICLLDDCHVERGEPHFYGYEHPSPRTAKDVAYAERDRLVAVLSFIWPSHLCQHDGDDWEKDWLNIVCIHGPTGQLTWHIHESELSLFSHLSNEAAHWDGHTTEEKYQRLEVFMGIRQTRD